MRFAGMFAALAAVPTLALLALWGGGFLAILPAVAAMLACLLGAVLTTALLRRDLRRLAAQLAAPEPGAAPPERPRLRSLARIAAGIDRQARRLAALASAADAARRSSETILDSLPDPLLPPRRRLCRRGPAPLRLRHWPPASPIRQAPGPCRLPGRP